MVSELFLAGVVWGSVLVVAGSAVLAWRQRPKPGATAFAVVMVAATWWVATASLGLYTTDEALRVFWWKVEWAGVASLPVAWLVFALVYTGRSEYVSPRSVAALGLLPTATLALALTNGVGHDLVAGPPTFHAAGSMLLVERSFGPWFWVHVAYSYLLVAAGTALVVGMVTKRRLLYRGQAIALVLVVAAPWFGSALYVAGALPVAYFDPTPYTFVISGAAGIAALSQLSFLDAVPVTNRVARRSVVENVDAGVVVADTDGRVVDTNPRARDLLDCEGESVAGDDVEACLPVDAATATGSDRSGENTTVVTDDHRGRTRYLDVQVTALQDDYDNVTGRIFLLRDVTERRTRLQRLGVLNRVLRHNLRNEMNVIYGRADRLARGEGDPERAAADIREKASELTSLADKARQIDGALDANDAEPADLVRVVSIECDRLRDAYPAVDLRVRTPDDELLVDAVAGAVVGNLLENAVEHNTASEPWVELAVTADDRTAEITVTDNGPGIPPGELAALEGDIETQLDHASGLGLWLVNWGVDAVGGSLSFEDRDPLGTRATVTLPLAEPSGTAPERADEASVADATVADTAGDSTAGDSIAGDSAARDSTARPTGSTGPDPARGTADSDTPDSDDVGENAGLLNIPFLKL